jgi:hypothetical protein
MRETSSLVDYKKITLDSVSLEFVGIHTTTYSFYNRSYNKLYNKLQARASSMRVTLHMYSSFNNVAM